MNVEQCQVVADPQTWAVSLPICCCHLQPPLPFIIITESEFTVYYLCIHSFHWQWHCWLNIKKSIWANISI